ncbi:MAG: SAM-dependent methyltransferase [Eggerthella lenta]
MNCLDIGSSTGGFTDCLLQAGASRVAALDVNYGQLAWKIRQDPRVAVFERTNIKDADPAEVGAPFDLIVIDVSFIGLAALAPLFPRSAARARLSAWSSVRIGPPHRPGASAMVVRRLGGGLLPAGFTATGAVESPSPAPKARNTSSAPFATSPRQLRRSLRRFRDSHCPVTNLHFCTRFEL